MARILSLLLSVSITAAAAGEAPPDSADPRVTLIELRIEGRFEAALGLVEVARGERPQLAREIGLDYLRGRLLLELDRRQEALEAFAATMSSTPELGPFGRFRLALEQESLGHPEVAAGLVATLLRSGVPGSLNAQALRLLRRTILDGGDCRVLRGLDGRRLAPRERRELELASAECHRREGDVGAAERIWIDLLETEQGDVVARLAAERLALRSSEELSPRAQFLIGLAFHHHREFETAIQHLALAQARLSPSAGISRREVFDLRYALARSHFWQRRYEVAAAGFAALAVDTTDPRRQAQALYQEARSFELGGDWRRALAVFRQVAAMSSGGGWADSGRIAEMRLSWLAGDETAAVAALETLLAERHYNTGSRALLFLASSVIADPTAAAPLADSRPAVWLERAAALRRVDPVELHYWQGRLAEREERVDEALDHYLASLGDDAHHPFGRASRERLRGVLSGAADVRGKALAVSNKPGELFDAWLLLDADDPRRGAAQNELLRRLESDASVAPFRAFFRVPAGEWPLWGTSLERPEEKLLALGLFDEAGTFVLHHFPIKVPALAFTGSVVLASSGDTKRSLYIAEILAKQIPEELPPSLWPEELRRLLYPLHHAPLIHHEAASRRVDPNLLAAIIREESRFDPHAFSAAAARGLTQFIAPTARQIAAVAGLGEIEPYDLERPEVAIALGAAYLRQLGDEFADSLPEIIAAYNAGEPQAALWRSYCKSTEAEEYLTKVAFRETRNYLFKVLTSRAHYADLYAERGALVLASDE